MDTELLRTFLEVRSTRHFGKAATNLYITQAAVSSRIKLLEQMLGTPLFVRHRNNLQLTDTGERLVSHAEEILSAWERAKRDLTIRKNSKETIRFAATPGFCAFLLQENLGAIYRSMPELVLRADSLDEETLMVRLRDRRIDVGLLFDPAKHVDFVSEPVTSAELVLVSTEPGMDMETTLKKGYVAVDWGVFFSVKQKKLFSEFSSPVLQTSLSRIALEFILEHGGSAYLPYGLVKKNLEKQQLFWVEEAPVIHQPIYAIYHENTPYPEGVGKIIQVLRDCTQLHTTTREEFYKQFQPLEQVAGQPQREQVL